MTARSASRAWNRARSVVTVTNALSLGCVRSMAASTASVNSTGDSFFCRISDAARLAESLSSSSIMALLRWPR